jgi:hypothetical protein
MEFITNIQKLGDMTAITFKYPGKVDLPQDGLIAFMLRKGMARPERNVLIIPKELQALVLESAASWAAYACQETIIHPWM